MKVALIAVMVVVLPLAAVAATPETMSYQGVLQDGVGVPVPDAVYSVTFRLYDVPGGGTELWTETQSITTSRGIFNVLLGSIAPLTLAFDDSYWLSIQVEGESELTPRTPLAAVPYAMRSKYSELTLPYSGSASSGTLPVFTVENPDGPAILAKCDLPTAGRSAIRADAMNGQMYAAMGYYGDGTLWGVYTLRPIFASSIQTGGDIESLSGDGRFQTTHMDDFHMDTAPADGYVLTSDASGYGTWQPPAVGSDGDWTVSGDDLYSANVGAVGVGTATPEEKLHVRDDLDGGVSYALKLDNAGNDPGTAVGALFKIDSGSESRGKGGLVYERTDTWNRGSFHFLQDSGVTYDNPDLTDAVMTIDNAGNVGIGTTVPTQRLQVAGTVHSTSGGFKFPDGTVQASAASGGLVLPYSGATSTSSDVFDISNNGTGAAITGTHTSTGNFGTLGGPIHGIRGETNVNSGAGVYALHNGGGSAVHANAPSGTAVEASSGTGPGVWATSSSADAIHAITGTGRAFYGEDIDGKTVTLCDADFGVSAVNVSDGTSGHVAGPQHGLYGETSTTSGSGVYALHNGGGSAVHGNAPSGTAVEASSGTGSGVWAASSSGDAVHAITATGRAFYGEDLDGKTATICDTDYGVHASNPDGTEGYIAGGSHGVHGETSVNSGAGVYALHNGAGSAVYANSPSGTAVEASSGTGSGIWASSGSGDAVHAISATGRAGYFEGGIHTDGFEFPSGASNGYVLTSDASGVGTWQPAVAGSDGDWVISGGNLYTGVSGRVGIGTSSPGVKLDVEGPGRIKGYNWASSGAGMEFAYSPSSHKGYIQVYDRDAGTWGKLYLGNGLVGIGTGYPDVQLDVYSTTVTAIQAQSTVGKGVDATGFDIGVRGAGATGVHGDGSTIGVYGTSAVNAGWFDGNVMVDGSTINTGDLDVQGTLSKAGGQFKIDHPLDPENKYLCHSFVESPDMMNIYNGNAVLNEGGEAWIELPDWFEALNMDFRYQLTCIGGHAPVYVAEEISDNRFKVAGGSSGLKVSWQVTGVRHDTFAEANRIQVEVDKE